MESLINRVRLWTTNLLGLPNPSLDFQMFNGHCVVKYLDSFGIEHAAKAEAESLFEAAIKLLDGRGCASPFHRRAGGA